MGPDCVTRPKGFEGDYESDPSDRSSDDEADF